MKNLIITVVTIIIAISSVHSQTKIDSTVISKNKLSGFTMAFLPTIIIPMEGDLRGCYSIGYGFTFNTSYQIIKNISISGNIEIIFSHFKITSMMDGRDFYETTSRWFSMYLGPKIYLNNSSAKIYLNSNFRLIYIYHRLGNIRYYLRKSPEIAFGLDFGLGVEIPINKDISFEINPGCNILFPSSEEQTLNYGSTYYRIAIGLSHNL